MRLVRIGVLEKVQESEWGMPVFIIPKKEETVCFLTEFRKVKRQIVCKPFPIPRIVDTLQQLEGFTFATALDLNMGYYTIPLAESSKDVTTMSLNLENSDTHVSQWEWSYQVMCSNNKCMTSLVALKE